MEVFATAVYNLLDRTLIPVAHFGGAYVVLRFILRLDYEVAASTAVVWTSLSWFEHKHSLTVARETAKALIEHLERHTQ